MTNKIIVWYNNLYKVWWIKIKFKRRRIKIKLIIIIKYDKFKLSLKINHK